MNIKERRAKHAAYMREWNRKNPEKVRAVWRAWATEERREVIRQRAKAWYWANRKRALAAAKRRYADKPKGPGHPTNEAHPNWKADNVSYSALHMWVVRNRGRPQHCEHCGTTEKKMYHWANIDHCYRRNLNDYIRLCCSCHKRHDYAKGLSKIGGRWPRRPPA